MIEIQQIASAVKGLLYTGRISPKIQPFPIIWGKITYIDFAMAN